MKNTLTILLLMVMLVQSFSKVFIVLDYQANKNYIAAFLCVNKAKPQLHCQGHCYLKKQLKKAEQAENQTTNPKQKLPLEITLFYQALFTHSLATGKITPKYLSFYKTKSFFAIQRAIFHPPQLTA